MKDLAQCELEVLAAVGKLIISKLGGRDDLARAIFDALYPQFRGRYPYHKALSYTVLVHVKEIDESKEDIIAKAQGRSRPFPNLLDDLGNLDKPDGINPIKTADDYHAALKEIEGLMAAKMDTPDGDRLDILATLVEAYEAKYCGEREDWQEYSAAMRTIATAFGTTVHCHQKSNRLAVDFRSGGLTTEQFDALAVVENLVELVSEFPVGYLEKLEPPGQ